MMDYSSHQHIPRTATGQIPSVFQSAQTALPDPIFDPFSYSPISRPPTTALPSASRTSGQRQHTSHHDTMEPESALDAPSRGASPADSVQLPQRPKQEESPQVAPEAGIQEGPEVPEAPEAGPSTAPARRVYARKPKKKIEKLLQYTTGFVPGLYNIKNPAGDYLQRETNVDVVRQVSQARAKREKEEAEAERARKTEAGEDVPSLQPLSHTLIIHPGSRNLRIGRASDFYPKEIPFCIARPASTSNRVKDPPVPGSRAKRLAKKAEEKRERKRQKVSENGDAAVSANGEDEVEEDNGYSDPVDRHIEDLRDYLRTRLRVNRLSTDHRDGFRVKQYNAKVKPEPIPEHNDPYRIDWTDEDGKKFFVGTDALRLPSGSGFKIRYPMLQRSLNTRDYGSPQQLLDDIATILHESLRTELGIHPREYSKFSVVLLIPDHGDRLHLQALVSVLFGEFGFKELAIHQEAHAAIFSAGMSTACVVDIGATTISVTCVDEGLLNADTRIKLDYGGDDITAALVALLTRANFPYKELDLARAMDWAMMDKLKEKIATLEEHMVANVAWDIFVLKEQGLTQKYNLRTYDENILAPLCFFDTRMIDFREKKGSGRNTFWEESEEIDDQLSTGYDEATGAMRACTTHLLPVQAAPPAVTEDSSGVVPVSEDSAKPVSINESPVKPLEINGSQTSTNGDKRPNDTPAGSTNGTPAPPDSNAGTGASPAPAPTVSVPTAPPIPASAWEGIDVVGEAAQAPLDAAIAASISMAGTENKIKAAAGSILLIGGGSALKGLYPFIAERLPPLLRAKGLPISDVSIVPPPRNLNPRFVSWKGASVMCNLESLSDMWIRRDEWEALGARTLKERLLFL